MDVPIAVIGVACRFPGADGLDAFWELLREGRDAVGTLPADRFTHAQFLHPRKGEPGRSYTLAAGALDDVAGFDPAAFGLSPREAEEMDPQQRLLLEVAAHAFEDAGWPLGSVAGRPIGTWIGGSSTDYGDLSLSDVASADRYFMTGNALSILANRLTNVFDLRGPAQTIDTACSSSLVALHQACEALRSGRVEAALVGGVQLLLSPYPFVGFARAGMLSPTGRCHAFDARADGYVRAEGAGAVLLKPLPQALADGDAVRGVILATGVNAAGRTMGLSLPSREAQAALLRQVMEEAGADPDRFAYFEAHGTGTQAGDPSEAWAIGEALARRRARPLPIGSVKTNIGHTEPASGMAGLLKAMLVLERGEIPPSLHFSEPNPNIDFSGLKLQVTTTREKVRTGASLAGVNSFGFGGTNASAVLAAPPKRRRMPENAKALPPLLISARSATALRSLAGAWAERLEATPAQALPALLRGAAHHRDLHPHRLALRGGTGPALARKLAACRAGERPETVATGVAPRAPGVLAFVFSGNGAQWAGMAQATLARNPAFRAAVAEADAALAPLLGWSALELLEAGVTAEALAATDVAQPLLFAIQAGMVAALAAQGIKPGLCLGHSVGEAAAARAAGLLSLSDAARLVVVRSRQQHRTRGEGRMAALGAGPDQAAPLLAACGPGLEIAAFNAPDAVTVAGPAEAIARLVEAAKSRRLSCVELDLDYAFHSAAMEKVRAGLLHDLAGLEPGTGSIPFVSSVTGALIEGTACGPDYWWRNLRQPVRFGDAVRTAAEEGARLFLEIGPNPVLQSYLRESLRAAGVEGAAALPGLSRRDPPDADPLPAIADRAFALGADPRQGPAFAGATDRRRLPHTPFDRQRIWLRTTVEAVPLTDRRPDHPLLGLRERPEPRAWTSVLDTALHPWLADHRLAGDAVLPAAAMADMALAAAARRFPEAAALELQNFQILRAVPLEADRSRELRLELDEDTGGGSSFRLLGRRRLSDEGWTLHARGRLGAAAIAALSAPPAARAERHRRIAGEEVVEAAARIGLDYGPAFRPVMEVLAEPEAGRARVTLRLPEAAPADDAGFILHPVRLDGALQGLIGLLSGLPAPAGTGLVPVRFGRLVARPGTAPAASAELVVTRAGTRAVSADLLLRDAAGAVVARLTDLWLQRIRLPGAGEVADHLFRLELVPAAEPGTPPPIPSLASALQAAAKAAEALDLTETALLLEGFVSSAAQAALSGPAALEASAYAAALRHVLVEDGIADATGGWHLLPGQELPPAADIWRSALAEQPTLAKDLAWLAEAAERLPRILRDPRAEPASPPPDDGGGMDRLAVALAAAAEAIAANWPETRPLRVLELGSPGGALTRHLLERLAPLGRRILYCAAGPAARLRPPVPAEGIEFSTELWDPASGAAPPVVADLVVGLGLAAGARMGGTVLSVLRPALAEGGTLLLAEPLPGRAWVLACGQDPGWWRNFGPGGGALPDAEGWAASLASAGFLGGSVLPLSCAPWPAALVSAQLPAAAAALAEASPRPFLLFAEEGALPLAKALADALQTRGARAELRALEEAASTPPRALAGAEVVALTSGDGELAKTLAALVRLAEAASGSAAGFTLATRGGQQPTEGTHVPEGAAALALARVLANEMPALKPRRIDLAPELSAGAAARRLLRELLASDGEPEVTLTAAARLVPRLRRGAGSIAASGPLALAIRQPGQLGSLAWEPAALRPPGPGEVAIRVEAAGLNFRDLMWAQGLLPEEVLMDGFAGPTLGMECAGVVEAVGPDVALRPGSRVFGIAPAALASRTVTRAEALAPLPEGIGFAEAATIPVAFLTAVYALESCARLQPGETVLIHGGAGAVGLAALQVALAARARVAATAGTPAKRAFLRAAGAELVLDSRDPGFADALRAEWPEGVDIVLNSLAGDAMERSLELTKPFGRFLELGKRDFVEDRRAGLRPLRRNVTYFAIDVDALPRARPAEAARLLGLIRDRLATGGILPLPHQVHAATEAEAAFRALQASSHIGKLVLVPPRAKGAAPAPWRAPSDGPVVVVGGTRGFGLATSAFLAEHGARHLVLVGRSPAPAGALDRLRALGAEAITLACDATDATALSRTLGLVRAAGLGPIRGIVHAAAVFDDGAAVSMDRARFQRVLEAKLEIGRNLDRLTAEDPLVLFLMFSSATTAFGNPGQANYVAANAALEALARRRRSAGKPALAIAWGPISDAGVLAGAAETAAVLQRRLGVEAMPAAEALSCLPALLASQNTAAAPCLAKVAWAQARMALPVLAEPKFLPLRGSAGAEPAPAEAGELKERLRSLPRAEAEALLRRITQEELARILRLPPEAVAPDAPVAGLGLDSLGGLELRTGLEQRLGAQVPMAAVSEDLTVEALARRIADAVIEERTEQALATMLDVFEPPSVQAAE
jgi:acyl transferase domain-containing protein/NADPH:quinone reductase-like Zn-dependent oxidoreductase/acyl carrier protein